MSPNLNLEGDVIEAIRLRIKTLSSGALVVAPGSSALTVEEAEEAARFAQADLVIARQHGAFGSVVTDGVKPLCGSCGEERPCSTIRAFRDEYLQAH